ncbi:hypothetical protein [Brevibacillus dissolubilis]|uniref:hypothetical protein n=1 Tax=Brevibacillus dissolubilis TaxID=1844116 RepID=UPI001116D607|nr:hypothetical protein [Brevibacillus dissolubilis]
MKERNILAGFHTMDEADKAAEQLKQAGIDTVQVDQVGQYPGIGVEKVLNPITGEIPSLGNLTLSAEFPSGRDASILAAADPDASGLSDGRQGRLASNTTGILLTCVVAENRAAEAEQIISSNGGEF